MRTPQTGNGDVFGGWLGSFLSVTPDISLLPAASAISFSADHFDTPRSPTSDRLRGVVEIGAATTIARGLFLNVTAGIGVTPAAPDFALTVLNHITVPVASPTLSVEQPWGRTALRVGQACNPLPIRD